MARRTKRESSNDFSNFRSVYLDFNDNERSEIVQFAESSKHDLSSVILERATDGWKISISYSASWGNYVCSVTPKEVPDLPSNVVYIFRHSDDTRVSGFLHYFFGVMVPNSDARLRGEVTNTEW